MAIEQEGQAAPAAGTTESTGTADTTATTSVTQAPAASEQQRTGVAPSGFTFAEDRKNWLPPHRFNEVNEKAKRYEAEIAERDRKIAALAGIQPTDPKSEKANQVKEAFLQMFPQFKHLVGLTEDQMQALVKTPESVGRAAEVETREWARHGKTQMSALFERVADVVGADELNADQQSELRDSFSTWFKGKVQAELKASDGAESATLSRYEDGDAKLLDEFVKRFSSNWVEPARRKATQLQINRTRPVPNSQGRSQVTSVPASLTGKSLDDRLDYAATQLFGKS